MKHKIIQIENYLLIVDDSQITEGDYCLANAKTYNNEIVTYRKSPCPPPFVSNLNILKKIIAHLPLNGASILNGVDLLSPLEDDVDILLKIEQEDAYKNGKGTISWYELDKRKEYYNKAKEKYKYTEEDLRKAIDMARKDFDEEGYLIDRLTEDEIIQSLHPKMPIGFNLEAKDTHIQNGVLVKSQWVGEYIFE